MSFVSTGEYLIRLLEAYDVEYVFGIPGVHTVELYRGLETSTIRHITPRHEQGAGFMADGYARVTGKPGVCLVITGPGLSNIATAMLQARADSIPMLVLSAVNDPDRATRGDLHEMPDQSTFAQTVAVSSRTIGTPDDLDDAIAEAYRIFETARPGPVHIEVPLAVMKADCSALISDIAPKHAAKLQPSPDGIERAVDLLRAAARPLILAGGGARRAASQILALAERLNAAIVTTINARSSFPAGHPLVLSASPSLAPVRTLISEADCVLAIGTELGPTDYDMYGDSGPLAFKSLIRVDADTMQLSLNAKADLALQADAALACDALLKGLGEGEGAPSPLDLGAARMASSEALSTVYREHIALLEGLRDDNPDLVIVGDSTQLIYAANMGFSPGDKGYYFNSATGYGTLGYALPAGIGAGLGAPAKPVLIIIGDGGVQFTLGELGALHDYAKGVVVLVWNNDGYGEIRDFMVGRAIKPEGVDLAAPDFVQIANAYGLDAISVHTLDAIRHHTCDAIAQRKTLIIDAKMGN
ncbi:MAG: 5-guanidino-2-oxopentanoate decarboxylase [Pseudomonadota bacterium]